MVRKLEGTLMATRWTDNENAILKTLLVNNVAIATVQQQINRSDGAISKKAYNNGYRTESDNGVKVLKLGITKRQHKRKSSTKTTATTQTVVTSKVSAKSPIEANQLAIEMLSDYNISITPEIIYVLSSHIILSQEAS